jgi:hypothetical protein
MARKIIALENRILGTVAKQHEFFPSEILCDRKIVKIIYISVPRNCQSAVGHKFHFFRAQVSFFFWRKRKRRPKMDLDSGLPDGMYVLTPKIPIGVYFGGIWI